MRIAKLQLQHFRCIQRAEITPGPGLNWLSGSNGAGKTTLLESVYLLSHGHSFRRGAIETLIQRGQSAFLLHAEILRGAERQVLGMSRTAAGWHLRLNGRDLQQLAPFLEGCAAICFEPGGHSLVSGASEGRRRFLDWGVFHVEPRFLEYWRRYRRALRQRNALLRMRNHEEQFAIWETEIEGSAEPLEKARQAYAIRLELHLSLIAGALLPELGTAQLNWYCGWDRERALQDVLQAQRARDRELGYTRAGPHRADWRISFEKSPGREYLSRGQTKLAALACMLAQARLFSDHAGEWPILCLDDLLSELDAEHLRLVLGYVLATPAQIWITSTRGWEGVDLPGEATLFHVEQGSILPG